MPKFEYLTLDLNAVLPRSADLKVLNAAGAEGWELVSISAINIAVLKRISHDNDDIGADEDVVAHADPVPDESEVAGADQRKTVAIKYRDPNNPENTWTGRGRMPRWMTAAIEGTGAKKEDFLI